MMQDKTLDRIVEFFNEIGCPVKTGLKRISANNEENISLEEYAVIYNGRDIMLDDKKHKKSAFEEKEGIDLRAYCGEYFLDYERLLKQLKKEGYKLAYKNHKQV